MVNTKDIIPIDPVTGERDWEGVPRKGLPQEKPPTTRGTALVACGVVLILAALLAIAMLSVPRPL